MQNLPIEDIIPELREKLAVQTTVVLQAPPGAGKSTLLPIRLLDEAFLAGRKIIMLKPRRLAVEPLTKTQLI